MSRDERKLTSATRVTVTVEIMPGDTWGPDCTIEQAERQGVESALRDLTGLLKGRARIVGEPQVVVVLVRRE